MTFKVRRLEDLREVLYHPDAVGPDPYFYIRNLPNLEKAEGYRCDLTGLIPHRYEGELTKTYGHYHAADVKERYQVLSGEALFLLQKPDPADPEKIQEISLKRAEAGDVVEVEPDFGHITINAGSDLLVVLNWEYENADNDYEVIKKLRGFGYYILMTKDGKITAEPNPNYTSLPELLTEGL